MPPLKTINSDLSFTPKTPVDVLNDSHCIIKRCHHFFYLCPNLFPVPPPPQELQCLLQILLKPKPPSIYLHPRFHRRTLLSEAASLAVLLWGSGPVNLKLWPPILTQHHWGACYNADAWMLHRVVLVVKNLPANARDIKDVGSIPGLGRSPGGEHGNPLWYSCLENPMDRGAWQATAHGVTKSRTWLSN